MKTQAQDVLITLVPAPGLTRAQENSLARTRGRKSSAEVHAGRLRAAPESVLQRGRSIAIQLAPGRQLVALGEQVTVRGSRDLSWTGRLQGEEGTVQLVLTPKGVTGTVSTPSALYRIEPIGDGLHALVKLGARAPEHPPEHAATGALLPGSGGPPVDREGAGGPSALLDAAGQASVAMQTTTVPTKIDVVVAYTPAVAAAVTDVSGLIQLAIDESNASYANSAINLVLGQAYSGQVSYTESGRTYSQHVSALQSTSDNMMDVVHTWRNQYHGDVVVLLVDDPAYCGMASQIYASATTAFAVVDYGCATGYYSFAHEIGHLQGARHDRYVDSSNSPFQYGHGYVAPNGAWRTIMGYADACGTCSRVQYWSNPNIVYPPTGQVMGTTTYENNARVLEETKVTIANFRSSLVASWTGPSSVGHNATCPWTASISGGTGPYSYQWSASWSSSNTGFHFTSGQGTASATSWGYYYNSYPTSTNIYVTLTGSDAAGERYTLQRTVQLHYSSIGCY